MLNDSIKGDPLTADPLPNATQPQSGRVVRVGRGSKSGGVRTLYLYLFDGTSVAVTVWIRVVVPGADPVWFQLGTPTVVLKQVVNTITGIPADAAAASIVSGGGKETKVFLQLTAPAGGPTKLGFAFVDG
jgi:hypothetical protein